ncbi:hypothetical protein F5146DRAFT_1118374 [Armillaria mellea]|nr:hypothetical protein F5146DRAFT_1118374 [Armillaria mellea]
MEITVCLLHGNNERSPVTENSNLTSTLSCGGCRYSGYASTEGSLSLPQAYTEIFDNENRYLSHLLRLLVAAEDHNRLRSRLIEQQYRSTPHFIEALPPVWEAIRCQLTLRVWNQSIRDFVLCKEGSQGLTSALSSKTWLLCLNTLGRSRSIDGLAYIFRAHENDGVAFAKRTLLTAHRRSILQVTEAITNLDATPCFHQAAKAILKSATKSIHKILCVNRTGAIVIMD